jgi:hypothetical protein
MRGSPVGICALHRAVIEFEAELCFNETCFFLFFFWERKRWLMVGVGAERGESQFDRRATQRGTELNEDEYWYLTIPSFLFSSI